MAIKVLAIGDLANGFVDLSKIVKNAEIHVINFQWDTASRLTESKEVEFFKSLKISEQVKKINSMKDDYDLAIVNTWAGARLAYLTGMRYIMIFVGSALRVPLFIKNPTLNYLKKPLPSLNFLERRFYRDVLNGAIFCGTNENDLYEILKKYRKKDIFLIRNALDFDRFNENVIPIDWKKEKFVFFSPQRIGLAKGIDIIWKAIELTKTDFQVLQVEWFLGQRTEEEREKNKNLVLNKPTKVKLIPVIKREEIPNVFAFVDGVIGQMRNGLGANVEKEAAMCKKPVIQYADPKYKFKIGNEEKISPFLPQSNDPQVIADLIDKIVSSEEFRDELIEKEYSFVKKIADPDVIAQQWEELFFKIKTTENRKKSELQLKFRVLNFLIVNRLYTKKVRKSI